MNDAADIRLAITVIFPLACIWFADAMGGFVGPASTIAITASSPGILVRILGWVVLVLPLVFVIVEIVRTL